MTGLQFDQIVDRKLDSSYTGFYDLVVKKPDVYRESLVQAIKNAYQKDDEQRETDKLINLITVEEITLTASEFALVDLTNSDYYHLLALRVFCQDFNFDFTGAVINNAVSPNTITFKYGNQLRDKEILIDDDDNIYYVKRIRPLTYQLYTDEGLTSPTVANDFVSPPKARCVNYYAKQQYPDQLIGLYGQPSIYLPRVTLADGKLKIAPLAETATLHYIKTLPVLIDPLDDTDDLEETYPYDLLIDAADVAVEKIALERRNYTRYSAQKSDNQQSNTVIM